MGERLRVLPIEEEARKPSLRRYQNLDWAVPTANPRWPDEKAAAIGAKLSSLCPPSPRNRLKQCLRRLGRPARQADRQVGEYSNFREGGVHFHPEVGAAAPSRELAA